MNYKPSITGLMNQQHEVHRLENLFYKKVNSAYYLPDYGLDWDFFVAQNVEIPVNSFISYLTQRAGRQGLIMLETASSIENFTFTLNTKLLGEEITLLRGV
jgi:hypothetical protein